MTFLKKGMMGSEYVSAGLGDGAEDIPELAYVDTMLSGSGPVTRFLCGIKFWVLKYTVF